MVFWGDIATSITAVTLALVFVVQYTLRTHWWANVASKAVVLLTLSVPLILTPRIIDSFLHAGSNNPLLLFILLAGRIPVILALTWIIATFRRVQRAGDLKNVHAHIDKDFNADTP